MATTKSFPLTLCLAATFFTGLGLIASAANLQWGAAPPDPDALQLAWPYVNVAWMWTWLLVWPSIALHPARGHRSTLLFDFLVILVAAIPSVSVASFLGGIPLRHMLPALLLQIATGILTLGILAWRRRVPPALLAGLLAIFAVVMPVAEYLWMEFFPAAPQSWMQSLPLDALAAFLTGHYVSWGIPVIYTALGILLFLAVPRA
jgi:hypothetical protein